MIDDPIILLIVLPPAAYVLGATPFGVILSRANGVDIRTKGSGNTGATNVWRVLGARWGALCFALDVGKGLAPVLAAGVLLRRLDGFPTALHQGVWLATGCGAILGHVFSFWLKFRGGKGVATALGVVLGIFPYFTWPGLAAFGVWIVTTAVFRYVSLGSIVAAGAFLPLFVGVNWWREGGAPTGLWPMGLFAALMAALIVIRHRGNIGRLLAGTETRIDTYKKKDGDGQE